MAVGRKNKREWRTERGRRFYGGDGQSALPKPDLVCIPCAHSEPCDTHDPRLFDDAV